MNSKTTSRFGRWHLLAVGCAAVLAAGWLGGCKRVTGTVAENQAPIVWFANVPPQDQRFSANSYMYWIGQDRDGQVVTYRYRVIRQTSLLRAIGRTGADTLANIQDSDTATIMSAYRTVLVNSNDSIWTYLTVNPQEGQPQTSVIVPLTAELSDPVRIYVPQWVFVQVIDDQGAYSNVAYRRILRNNNPPSSRLLGFDSSRTPFIDAPRPGGVATGIRMMWTATDMLDYPTEPPPFEFQWRLYGPYDSAKFVDLERRFREVVFVTRDARVYILGQHDVLEFCDTQYFADTAIATCVNLAVDTITVANMYGNLDTIMNIDDPLFANDTTFNVIADSSKNGLTGWVLNTRDSLYDAFRHRPSQKTQQARFIFWLRARDDARGPDVTPAFQSFNVVAPKYERDLLIADGEIDFPINPRNYGRARAYWESIYRMWKPGSTPADFSLDSDYAKVSQPQGNILTLKMLLSHKMVIFVSDDVHGSLFSPVCGNIFTACDAGVSVWVCGRSVIYGGENKAPYYLEVGRPGFPIDPNNPSRNFLYYFGVEGYYYAGWSSFLYKSDRSAEDFIGTASLNDADWPSMSVDTGRLRLYYVWDPDMAPFRADIGALPEVGYMVSTFGTDVLHLYRSKFGTQTLPDPIGVSFDGRPVVHQFNRGFFRTAVSLFTPYSLDTATANVNVLRMIRWMYEPFLYGQPGTAEFNFPSGPGALSAEEARRVHWERPRGYDSPLGSEF